MVVGAQRTGSTLLATTLGMVPGAAVAGELRLLWPSLVEGRPCACLKAAGDCEVWRDVVNEVLSSPGVKGHTVEQLAALNAESLRQRHLPTFLAGRIPPELAPLAAATRALYPLLAERLGVQTLIDSSKSPAFFAFTRLLAREDTSLEDCSLADSSLEDSSLDVFAMHLVRDVRGVVDSWSTDKVWKRDGWSEELRAKPWKQAVQEWVAMNAGAEAARVQPRVRFEDFTSEPERVLRRLISAAGLVQPTIAQLPLHDGAVLIRDNHAIGGNVDRFDVGPVPLRASEGWRSRMNPQLQARLWPLARRYGYAR
jgi:hypothetical protein